METQEEPVSTSPLHEEGAARSLLLFPAILSAMLVVTLIPAAVLVATWRRRRGALDQHIAEAASASLRGEEPRPTWREAYVDAVREVPSAL